jgi:hypothetical protein
MRNDTAEAKRTRLARRLGVVCDDAQTYKIRLAAVKAIQQSLPERNPLRQMTPEDLLESVKRPWNTRLVLENGRGVERPVRRPPEGLSDLWQVAFI